jgi:hypothetical protein
MARAAAGTPMIIDQPLPAWRWQFLQWHTACIAGSADTL